MARTARSLTRSVIAFDDPRWQPPELVVIDTNVIAEALLEDEIEHTTCQRLVRRLGETGTTVVFSRLLEMELWETVFNLGLQTRHPRKQLRHVRYDADARNEANTFLDKAFDGWHDILGSLSWSCIELEDVAPLVPDLMRSYGFQSYDAVHVGTLLVSGARDLITRDNGFAALLPEDARIHTTDARLASTRARRARVLAQRGRAQASGTGAAGSAGAA